MFGVDDYPDSCCCSECRRRWDRIDAALLADWKFPDLSPITPFKNHVMSERYVRDTIDGFEEINRKRD